MGARGPAIQRAQDTIALLPENKPWRVDIKPYRKERSVPQIRYFWGVVVKIICDETGNDPNDMHDWLCGECFGWETREVMGSQRKVPARTISSPKKLSTEEMEEFNEWCRARMAQEGILIPLPNDADF